MMTRSIVGRFLILAVLLVSLGVIAQAAIIISKQSGKAVAKADPAPPAKLAAAAPAEPVTAPVAAPAADPVPGAAIPAPPALAPAAAIQPVDAAPIRVVYPGPLGDAPALRNVADAAPAAPTAPAAVADAPTAADPAPAAPAKPMTPAKPAAVAKPAAAVVASADADAQAAAPPASGKGGVDLNSASVAALNSLGGGHIGQAIVAHRPYHSVDDLVKKRIVRRSVYDQIKDQVAAN